MQTPNLVVLTGANSEDQKIEIFFLKSVHDAFEVLQERLNEFEKRASFAEVMVMC